MPKLPIAALALAVLAAQAVLADPAEARHRRHHHHHHHHLSMHGWCRADAAQMMGVRRSAVRLAPQVLRTDAGRYLLPGVASHGRFGERAFVCHFNERGVLQGAV